MHVKNACRIKNIKKCQRLTWQVFCFPCLQTDTMFAGLLTETPAHSGHCTDFFATWQICTCSKDYGECTQKKKKKSSKPQKHRVSLCKYTMSFLLLCSSSLMQLCIILSLLSRCTSLCKLSCYVASSAIQVEAHSSVSIISFPSLL